MSTPSPEFLPIPDGWTHRVDSLSGMEYLTRDGLGELGMIVYDPEMVGGYYLPGRGNFCPWDTLAEAVASAEDGGRQ